MSNNMDSSKSTFEHSLFSWEWLVQFRRTLHMYPEPSFEEFITAELVKKVLINKASIEPSQIRCHLGKEDESGTGIIVDIMGEGENKRSNGVDPKKRLIMFRADLDALRMQEENTHEQIPYHSVRNNCAHMCGHDGHVAALVGLAIVLNTSSFKKMLPSNFGARLIFQPAEEYIGGAEPMIKLANCLEDVEEVYGWHNWPLVDLGTILLKEGAVMAHETEFYIIVRGKGGHASAPDQCIDPLICAANIVMSLQAIPSRFLPSSTNSVISVTQVHCGPLNLQSLANLQLNHDGSKDIMESLIKNSATNVISDTCYLSGTIRDCNRETTFLEIIKHMRRIVESTSESYQCKGELEIVEQYMETRNSKDCVDVVQNCVNNKTFCSTPSENVRQTEPSDVSSFPTNIESVTTDGLPLMGSEDFAYYLKERPGCFVIVGTKEEYFTNLTSFTFDKHAAISTLNSCIEIYNSEKQSKVHGQYQDEKSAKISKIEDQENFQMENRLEHEKTIKAVEVAKEENCNKARSNCCAHGTTFDFNDNVLPSIISLFLNIASNRLIEDESKQKLFRKSIEITNEGVLVRIN